MSHELTGIKSEQLFFMADFASRLHCNNIILQGLYTEARDAGYSISRQNTVHENMIQILNTGALEISYSGYIFVKTQKHAST